MSQLCKFKSRFFQQTGPTGTFLSSKLINTLGLWGAVGGKMAKTGDIYHQLEINFKSKKVRGGRRWFSMQQETLLIKDLTILFISYSFYLFLPQAGASEFCCRIQFQLMKTGL